MARNSHKAAIFWPLFAAALGLDVATKLLAVSYLAPEYVPHQVLGNAVQLTLAYNPGASFGIEVGPYSRVVFTVLAIGALVILGRMYRTTAADDRLRATALALICAGAAGNLIDRLRSERGVVDFIDLGLADVRFYTFNVADVAITTGALVLGWILWRDDRRHARAQQTIPESQAAPS